MGEAIRRLIKLSRRAFVAEVLENLRSKRLSEEELEALAKLREELRMEGVWLRRS